MHRLTKPLWRIEAPAEGGEGAETGSEGGAPAAKDSTFTQSDVDRIVRERVQRERTKFADYDDLKKAAAGAKTVEDRMAEVEQRAAQAEARALRADIAVKFAISAEDRDLFLTGGDEEALMAQAKRLADREAERKKQGPRVPNEGKTPNQKDDPLREVARTLFNRND